MSNETLKIGKEELGGEGILKIDLSDDSYWGKDEQGQGEHMIYIEIEDEVKELIEKIKFYPTSQAQVDSGMIDEAQHELSQYEIYDFQNIFKVQMQAVRKIQNYFQALGLDFSTPLNLAKHYRQEDSHEKNTCVIASIRNALEALSSYDGEDRMMVHFEDEKSLISRLGGPSVFETDGNLDLEKVGPFLQKEFGLQTVPSSNIMALIHELELGGVAIAVTGKHASLVSGATIRGGDIRLKIYDPLEDEVKLTSLEDFVRDYRPNEFCSNLLLIQRQPEIKLT